MPRFVCPRRWARWICGGWTCPMVFRGPCGASGCVSRWRRYRRGNLPAPAAAPVCTGRRRTHNIYPIGSAPCRLVLYLLDAGASSQGRRCGCRGHTRRSTPCCRSGRCWPWRRCRWGGCIGRQPAAFGRLVRRAEGVWGLMHAGHRAGLRAHLDRHRVRRQMFATGLRREWSEQVAVQRAACTLMALPSPHADWTATLAWLPLRV